MGSVTPPSAASIFPDFIPELEEIVVFHLSDDTKSLLNFSAVSRRASELVSKRFKELFEQKYFGLAKSEKIYQTLREHYPSECWKVMSCLQSKQEPYFSFRRDFLVQAVPSLHNSLQLQKVQLEKELSDICGCGFADPASPIHQAWVAFKQNEQNLASLQTSVVSDEIERGAITLFEPFIEAFPNPIELKFIIIVISIVARCRYALTASNERINSVDDLIEEGIRDIIRPLIFPGNNTDKEVRDALNQLFAAVYNGSNIGEFSAPPRIGLHLIPRYHEIITFICYRIQQQQPILELSKQIRQNRDLFDRLETKREECVSRLKEIEEKLQLHGVLPEDVTALLQLISKIPEDEWETFDQQGREFWMRSVAADARRARKLLPIYDQCFKFIEKLMNRNEFPENPLENYLCEMTIHQELHYLINSLPPKEKAYIWGSLYAKCAGGIIEDSWAEKHFPQFLPELKELINEKIQLHGLFRILGDHEGKLVTECGSAFLAQRAFELLPTYDRCSQLIKALIDHDEFPEDHPLEKPVCDTHQEIRGLINSLPIDDRGWIWGSLYEECAGGILENNWAEIHFPEFLTELRRLVDQKAFVSYRVFLPSPAADDADSAFNLECPIQ